jgi:dihydrofolate reductase
MTAGIGLIWAEAAGGVIGAEGGMPWYVPEDLAHFKEVTAGATVVMGRKTWASLPDAFRPLPGRRNIVVTRNDEWSAPGAERASSLDAALREAARGDAAGRVWVIGGGEIFRAVIARADRLEVTELDLEVDGDTFAPDRRGWSVVNAQPRDGWATSRSGTRYRFLRLERPATGSTQTGT